MQALFNAARDGDRLVLVGGPKKPLAEAHLWRGLGNRAGLHSFASELLAERWAKGEKRLRRKLERLPAGSVVEVRTFRNHTRDRGRWVTVRTITL